MSKLPIVLCNPTYKLLLGHPRANVGPLIPRRFIIHTLFFCPSIFRGSSPIHVRSHLGLINSSSSNTSLSGHISNFLRLRLIFQIRQYNHLIRRSGQHVLRSNTNSKCTLFLTTKRHTATLARRHIMSLQRTRSRVITTNFLNYHSSLLIHHAKLSRASVITCHILGRVSILRRRQSTTRRAFEFCVFRQGTVRGSAPLLQIMRSNTGFRRHAFPTPQEASRDHRHISQGHSKGILGRLLILVNRQRVLRPSITNNQHLPFTFRLQLIRRHRGAPSNGKRMTRLHGINRHQDRQIRRTQTSRRRRRRSRRQRFTSRRRMNSTRRRRNRSNPRRYGTRRRREPRRNFLASANATRFHGDVTRTSGTITRRIMNFRRTGTLRMFLRTIPNVSFNLCLPTTRLFLRAHTRP